MRTNWIDDKVEYLRNAISLKLISYDIRIRSVAKRACAKALTRELTAEGSFV